MLHYRKRSCQCGGLKGELWGRKMGVRPRFCSDSLLGPNDRTRGIQIRLILQHESGMSVECSTLVSRQWTMHASEAEACDTF